MKLKISFDFVSITFIALQYMNVSYMHLESSIVTSENSCHDPHDTLSEEFHISLLYVFIPWVILHAGE